MIQRRGRVVTDTKIGKKKSFLSALQLMSNIQISTQKYGSGHGQNEIIFFLFFLSLLSLIILKQLDFNK